jgi:hypothetical protein
VGSKCKVQTNLPKLDEEGPIYLQLALVLDTRECQLRQHTISEVLIQWKDMPLKYVHMGTSYDFVAISLSSAALRTMLFFKGGVGWWGGMLGSYPNLPTLSYIGVSKLLYAAILFE